MTLLKATLLGYKQPDEFVLSLVAGNWLNQLVARTQQPIMDGSLIEKR